MMKSEMFFPARVCLQINLRINSAQSLILATIFFAYRKTVAAEEILKKLQSADETTKTRRIRCPFCRWQPSKSSRWYCADCDAPEYFYGGCQTNWNTFATGGICPGCAHQWRWTSCLRCAEWSRHEDWYENE